jgi:hypothetical protein
MSDPKPCIPLRPWVGSAILVLLAAQTALLWVQGSLLHRQHQDLVSLRDEIQYLSESLEQNGQWDEEGGPAEYPSPARHRRIRHPRLQRAARIQEEDAGALKDVEASRRSAQEAVAKGREAREKLSIEENARKAEEKAKALDQGRQARTWIWAGAAALAAAYGARVWLRKRG